MGLLYCFVVLELFSLELKIWDVDFIIFEVDNVGKGNFILFKSNFCKKYLSN